MPISTRETISVGRESASTMAPVKAQAMTAMARHLHSYASLPTTTTNSPSSSSPSSSSSSLPPPPLLDLFDYSWFYSSVLPLPSISIPCLPNLSSSPPPDTDTSTLLAQCMFDSNHSYFALDMLECSHRVFQADSPYPEATCFSPVCNTGLSGNETDRENAYCGYISVTESDDEDSLYTGYPRQGAAEDEEAYHYYTAASDWEADDEDFYNGYPTTTDNEDESKPECETVEESPANQSDSDSELESEEDPMSDIHDVRAFHRDQQYRGVQQPEEHLTSSQFLEAAVTQVSALSTGKDQAHIKASLKLWAHAVASTLPWKAAAQARPLL
ncbi:hypothetical protein KP509_31G010600 [Ceratopteris richardii]|uniref:Uncharacterized protein n=1 Tax=Ceratopteris richardii TaxID=49495 RepID=A0A8T2QVK4_CERRI|nr:hypothetical protein KP509_31G010600 [Ceratopteris richardii]